MTMKLSKHGGPRPGAGRKSADEKRVALQIRLPPDLVAWLDRQPGSRTGIIERLVRAAIGENK